MCILFDLVFIRCLCCTTNNTHTHTCVCVGVRATKRELQHPIQAVLLIAATYGVGQRHLCTHIHTYIYMRVCKNIWARAFSLSISLSLSTKSREKERLRNLCCDYKRESVNDPFAGSPTKTLLRLLLPLNGKVQSTSPQDTRCHC
jgi:hypothetical protein